jgi:hypothetical protein
MMIDEDEKTIRREEEQEAEQEAEQDEVAAAGLKPAANAFVDVVAYRNAPENISNSRFLVP